jgi:hypothetical protein
MKVFVYFNLHRKCFSVKALEGASKGLVIKHATFVALTNVTFKVSEAGRQRVLQEQRKNVHAGVVGTLVDSLDSVGSERVTYNPYKGSTFVLCGTGDPLLASTSAALIVHEKKGFIYV